MCWGDCAGVVSVDYYVLVVCGVYGLGEFLLHCFFIDDGGASFFVV